MNGMIHQIYICAQLKIFFTFCEKRDTKIFKFIGFKWKEQSQNIKRSNLKYKNLISELGIFLIEK